MENISFKLSADYLEYYQVEPDLFIPLHFFLSETNEFMNAIDLMRVLGYKNCYAAWDKIKAKLHQELGKIQLVYEYIYEDGTIQEDFLTLNQIIEVIADSSRWNKGEKYRFMEWLNDAAPWSQLLDGPDTEIYYN